MKRDQFLNRFNQAQITQAELDRKWRLYQEQLEYERMLEAVQVNNQSQSTSTGAGGSGGTLGTIQFVVNTFDDLVFEFDFTSTGEPITFTIDWGDGTIHEDDGGGGYYPESHTYAEVGDYTVRVSFDDPLKILQLNFPGDGLAAIKSIRGLQNLANLQQFYADWNALETIDFSGLENLTYIDISDCDFVDSNESSLSEVILTGCINLDDIRIDDSNFSNGFPDFTGLDNLRYFDADDSNITGSLDLSFLPNLQGFDLSQNEDLTEVIISSSQALGAVESIYLDGCDLTQQAVDNILVALSTNGENGGYVDLSGGTNSPPSSTGLAAKTILEGNGWTVDINPPIPGTATIAPSTDFDIVGDFTIEMFINLSNDSGFPRPYSFGAYPAPNAISIEGGELYFWANNASLINSAFEPNLGQWYHICVMGVNGDGVYLFVDGIKLKAEPYGGTISSQGLPLTIGDGNEPNSSLNGLMSNFRWTNAAVYNITGFTPPTAPLTTLTDTILLIFQGTSLPALLTDNSGSGNNGFGAGPITYNVDNPFVGTQGSLQVGVV